MDYKKIFIQIVSKDYGLDYKIVEKIYNLYYSDVNCKLFYEKLEKLLIKNTHNEKFRS